MSKTLLVCDLDNTLYDWVSYFVPAFYAMVDKVVAITGCDRERLLDDFRAVHQKHHDSEQPFALLETDTITRIYGKADWAAAKKDLDPAFHAFNSERKRNLHLHQGVKETLDVLSRSGIKLIAHTDSKFYGAADRLKRLGLFEYFTRVYCRERPTSIRPDDDSRDWLEQFPMEKVVELTHHQTKPNPEVLLEICETEAVQSGDAAYVGDSIARDVLMAKRAGVYAIWAAYGAEHNPASYQALVRISHWTPEEVERERDLKDEAKAIHPDLVAHRQFSEVLSVFELQKVR